MLLPFLYTNNRLSANQNGDTNSPSRRVNNILLFQIIFRYLSKYIIIQFA